MRFFLRCIQLVLPVLLLWGDRAVSQELQEERGLNFSYSAVIGSGVYLLDDRTVWVLRVPFSKTLKASEPGHWGAKLLLPVTLGYNDLDADKNPMSAGGQASVSFVPGIEFQYMPNEHWAIKPFAHVGAGLDLDRDEIERIWAVGIRTRADVRFDTPRMTLGADALYAAQDGPDDLSSDSFSRLGVGIDFQFPLKLTVGNRSTAITTHIIHYEYVQDLEFSPELGDPYQIGSSTEIGVALGLDPPLRVMGFSLDRIGLGYRFGSDQKAIVLVRKFPF